MKQKSVFVVFGETGEYEDWQQWPVIAYLDKSKAEDHAKKAWVRANEIIGEYCDNRTYENLQKLLSTNEFDPNMQYSSPGEIEYRVEKVPFSR